MSNITKIIKRYRNTIGQEVPNVYIVLAKGIGSLSCIGLRYKNKQAKHNVIIDNI